MQAPDLRTRGSDAAGSLAKDTCAPEGQIPVKHIMWMTQRTPQPGGQWHDLFTLATWPGRGCLAGERRGAQAPRGHLRLALSSEPDLITAHTGHSIDVAQHWETDETSAGEETTRLRVHKLWPAVVLSHLAVCWFPCSGLRSEVVELKVGWEGHVLPRQAHIVEFQVVGVTTGRTKPGIRPGSRRHRFLLWGPFQND